MLLASAQAARGAGHPSACSTGPSCCPCPACRQREALATPLDPVEHRALLEQCAAAMRPTWTLDMGAFARVGCWPSCLACGKLLLLLLDERQADVRWPARWSLVTPCLTMPLASAFFSAGFKPPCTAGTACSAGTHGHASSSAAGGSAARLGLLIRHPAACRVQAASQ